MSSLAIRASGLGKQYYIKERRKYSRRFLTEAVLHSISEPFRRLGGSGGNNTSREKFWALRDVSFEVRTGEVVGIIGSNGAGKSTLLKIFSRITPPTEGRAELYGQVGALLEVGTGFHPELTGRENVYMNGAILGMKRSEIARKFDEIVAFAEVEQFIDMPIKRYSSGMGLRLAFSVAAHLNAEIMIVDEVLAVGDVAFQNKSIDKMNEVTQDGRTVLFVSHNLGAISRLCERTFWLDQGRVAAEGKTDDVIIEYLAKSASHNGIKVWENGVANSGIDFFKFHAVRLIDRRGDIASVISITDPFTIEIEYEITKRLQTCRVGYEIANTSGVSVFQAFESDDEQFGGPIDAGRYIARCKVPAPLLNKGNYIINLIADIPNKRDLALIQAVLTIDIVDTGGPGSYLTTHRGGFIRTEFEWKRLKA